VICVGCFYNLVCSGQSKVHDLQADLQDKIKGAGQVKVIGVTIRRTNEFRTRAHSVNAYQPIPWYDGYIKETMKTNRDCMTTSTWTLRLSMYLRNSALMHPLPTTQRLYSTASYMLWHANQAVVQYFEWNSPLSLVTG